MASQQRQATAQAPCGFGSFIGAALERLEPWDLFCHSAKPRAPVKPINHRSLLLRKLDETDAKLQHTR